MNTVTCKHCGKVFELSEALTHEMTEKIRVEQSEKFEKDLEKIKAEAEEKALKKAKDTLKLELKNTQTETEETSKKNDELQEQLLELRKEQRTLKQKDKDREIEMQKKLYLLPFIIPGVEISGGLESLFIGGVALALMFLVLKPILNIISFPINLITLGLFSVITNAFILYLMTRFVEGIKISPFTYESIQYAGYVIPQINFNIYIAFIFIALVVSLIESSLSWLME